MQFSTKEEGMKKHSENWQEGGGKGRKREGGERGEGMGGVGGDERKNE